MSIVQRIKEVREAKKLSQSEVANALNMERSNYHRLENRGEKLTIEQLESIAGALGVSVVELLTGETQTNNTGEVEELKKQIDLLLIKLDYCEKVQYLNDERNRNRETQIESYLHDIREFLAINNQIGIVKYTNKETGQIIKEKVAESNNNELEVGYYSFKYDREYIFTKDDISTLNKLIFTDSYTNWHVENLIKLGLIRDEGILYAYRQYLKSVYDEEET